MHRSRLIFLFVLASAVASALSAGYLDGYFW